jgi:hypothetical protein
MASNRFGSYSFALIVYRSALRRTGSIVFGLPDGPGCDALEDDMIEEICLANGDHDHVSRGLLLCSLQSGEANIMVQGLWRVA